MFIDSHCHLDFPCFSDGFNDLLLELQRNNINKVIIPGTQASGWDHIIQLSQQHAALYYALGLHPHFIDDSSEQQLTLLADKLMLGDIKCIALGEVGLDKFATAHTELQERLFIKQLLLAQQLNLPLIIHCVQRQGRMLALLKEHGFTQGGVYHAFSGSLEVAREFIKLGFKLGVGGVITHPHAKKVRQTIAQLPLESLLLETDAPDMPLYQQGSKYNSPLNIISIFNVLSELRPESKLQLETQLYENVANIFSLCDD